MDRSPKHIPESRPILRNAREDAMDKTTIISSFLNNREIHWNNHFSQSFEEAFFFTNDNGTIIACGNYCLRKCETITCPDRVNRGFITTIDPAVAATRLIFFEKYTKGVMLLGFIHRSSLWK
jgi:hypothetical protein